MSFIQSCFIRKNTPELRKKIEELGYEPNAYECFWEDNSRYIITYIDNQGYSYYTLCIKNSCLLENELFIDCGDNERLFLALAALRDDTDKNQYFICDKVSITLGKTYYPDDYLYYQYDEFFDKQNWHKATVEELIEHFK